MILICCTLISSCASQSVQTPVQDPSDIFETARLKAESGDTLGAINSFVYIRKHFPGHQLADEALFHAATLADADSPQKAIPLYEDLLKSFPDSPLSEKASENLFLDYLNLEKEKKAAGLFINTYPHQTDPMWSSLGYRLLNRLVENNYNEDALKVIATMLPGADEDTRQTLLSLWNTMIPEITDAKILERIEDITADSHLLEMLRRQKGRVIEENRDVKTRAFDRFGKEILVEKAPAYTIGVLAPLSGKFEAAGQKILKGIELASGVFTKGQSTNIEYVIMDYESDPGLIPGLIGELDTKHDVIAIIGPAGEVAGETACIEAEKRGIPSILFTQSELISKDDSMCFSNFISFGIQVRTLLDTARQMNITRFAILYPKDHFGTEFSSLFQQMAPLYGIEVIKTVEYSPRSVDFKNEVSSLVENIPEGEEPDFDALLIPDTAVNSAMIASYLPYFNIEGVRLFGPNLWDTPDFQRVGRKYVEDSVFVSGFFLGSQLDFVQEFNDSFYYTFGYNPSVWEASAFDTTTILQSMLEGEVHTRKSLKERIASIKDYPGVTGATSFNSDGSVDKIIFVLTVNKGSVLEITP